MHGRESIRSLRGPGFVVTLVFFGYLMMEDASPSIVQTDY
jgi:hypothetical protein